MWKYEITTTEFMQGLSITSLYFSSMPVHNKYKFKKIKSAHIGLPILLGVLVFIFPNDNWLY